jgi:hypothetical protein
MSRFFFVLHVLVACLFLVLGILMVFVFAGHGTLLSKDYYVGETAKPAIRSHYNPTACTSSIDRTTNNAHPLGQKAIERHDA